MSIYNYRIKQVEDLLTPLPCYIAQFSLKMLPFIWFDITPKGLGSNYGTNKEGAEIYIKHHKGCAND